MRALPWRDRTVRRPLDRGGRVRPVRGFRPEEVAAGGLERRAVPSATPAGIARAAGVIERANIPYPTPGGVERLNVYLPPGPTPSGGRPVILAIHGGGWRRLDKSGYGDRIASAFVPRGYVVVAPNYVL